MRRIAVAVGLSLGACASAAKAADITLHSAVTQSLEVNSNYEMRSPPLGPSYVPVTAIFVDALARTPTMRFIANADANYISYFGETRLLPSLNGGAHARAERTADAASYYVDAAVRVAQVARVQLAETATTAPAGSGDVIVTNLESGGRHELSGIDLVSWTARAVQRAFTDRLSGAPSVDLTLDGSLSHLLSPLTMLIPRVHYETIYYGSRGSALGFGNFAAPGAAGTQLSIWQASMGIDSRPTKRLSVRGSIGLQELILSRGTGAGLIPRTATTLPSGSNQALGWLADLHVDYKLTSRDNLTILAAQVVAPDTLGQIRKFQNVGMALVHRLNHALTLTTSADYSRQTSVTGVTDIYSAAVIGGWRMLHDWNLAVAYRFRQRIDETGTARGNPNAHSVLFTLHGDFTLLPVAGGETRVPVVDPATLFASPAQWLVTQRFGSTFGAPIQYHPSSPGGN